MSEVLMGYKGSSFKDTGYFYSPYVPLMNTPVVLDPNYGKVTVEKLVDTDGWGLKKKKKIHWNSIDEPMQPTDKPM